MYLTLSPDADPAQVQARLQGLGVWTAGLTGQATAVRGFRVLSYSQDVPTEALLAVPGVAEVFCEASPHPLVDGQAGQDLRVGDLRIAFEGQPVLMAGPCSLEAKEFIDRGAEIVASAGGRVLRGGAFKPRTSPYGFAGHGELALSWLRAAADRHGLKVLTEVLGEEHVEPVAAVADIIQIGSRNMQNFALFRHIGAAGLPVVLKRGRAATIEEWLLAGEHLLMHGAPRVIFCERGIQGADPHTRNLLDLGAVAVLRHVYRQVVIVDPSHAAGRRDLIPALAKAGLAAGAHGLLLEMHPDAACAMSDGPQALSPEEFRHLAAAMDLTRQAPARG